MNRRFHPRDARPRTTEQRSVRKKNPNVELEVRDKAGREVGEMITSILEPFFTENLPFDSQTWEDTYKMISGAIHRVDKSYHHFAIYKAIKELAQRYNISTFDPPYPDQTREEMLRMVLRRSENSMMKRFEKRLIGIQRKASSEKDLLVHLKRMLILMKKEHPEAYDYLIDQHALQLEHHYGTMGRHINRVI